MGELFYHPEDVSEGGLAAGRIPRCSLAAGGMCLAVCPPQGIPLGIYFQVTAVMPAVVLVGAVAAVAATRRSPSSRWRGAHRVASSQQPVRRTLRGQLAACKIPTDGFGG